jgi:hypothetical protein
MAVALWPRWPPLIARLGSFSCWAASLFVYPCTQNDCKYYLDFATYNVNPSKLSLRVANTPRESTSLCVRCVAPVSRTVGACFSAGSIVWLAVRHSVLTRVAPLHRPAAPDALRRPHARQQRSARHAHGLRSRGQTLLIKFFALVLSRLFRIQRLGCCSRVCACVCWS